METPISFQNVDAETSSNNFFTTFFTIVCGYCFT